ncbi:F-box/LRR-repeat protein 3 [Vitis vinifera]|uniref:F-box/LRR-repeat protein 3 n=1 Tax=Vitis vinifera TaxID=29760 RepID=A0A438KNM9_VITVI|nr:F-box/LRR-repeat protein 3 [Vitis vinifera]
MKTYKGMQRQQKQQRFTNPFTLVTDEIIFAILDFLGHDPFSRKSFSLVCKSFYSVESRHRKTLSLSAPIYSVGFSSVTPLSIISTSLSVLSMRAIRGM